MAKRAKGSMTVEAAFIVPLIILILACVMHLLFYLHDRNILEAAAHETLAIGSGHEKLSEDQLEDYFSSSVDRQTILLTQIDEDVKTQSNKVSIRISASGKGLKFETAYNMKRTNPEDYVRNKRKVETALDAIGEITGDKAGE